MSKIEFLNDIIEYLMAKALSDWEISKKKARKDNDWQNKLHSPLVSCNNLSSFADSHKTLGKSGLDLGGYIRVSTKKEAQITSIENQKKF